MKILRALTIPVLLIALSACGGAGGNGGDEGDGTAPPKGRPSTGPTPPKPKTREPKLPDTPAGRQLSWFLVEIRKAPIAEKDLRAHFNSAFLTQVPPAQFNASLGGLKGIRVTRLVDAKPAGLVAEVEAGGQKFNLSIAVDAKGKIETLLLQPAQKQPKPPASWQELDKRLAKGAPKAGFLAAELKADGTCRPVHGVAPGTARPLGSMFKLYVLAAVKKAIDGRQLTWDTELVIRDATKSWPSGELQKKPDGTKVTVRRAAELMISISDNTATDLLFDKVGRRAVEAQVKATSSHAEQNFPMLDTRDLFLLKGVDYPAYAKRYLKLDPGGRRAFLDRTLANKPLPKVAAPWTEPREIDTLEWFASPQDICKAYAQLQKNKDASLAHAMEINDAGLGLDKKDWKSTWFKGGSEPGVVTLSFLAESKDGRKFVVTTLASGFEPKQDPTVEMLSLAKGAYNLVR